VATVGIIRLMTVSRMTGANVDRLHVLARKFGQNIEGQCGKHRRQGLSGDFRRGSPFPPSGHGDPGMSPVRNFRNFICKIVHAGIMA